MDTLLQRIINKAGYICPQALASELRTSDEELAAAKNLSQEAISSHEGHRNETAQKNLRQLVSILIRVQPWCETYTEAFG